MSQKDTFWFKHDSNAKDDFKCMLVIEQLGCEGYGIFWILVETLREQRDYKYPFQLLGALARKYNTTEAKMQTVVTKYNLFEIDEKSFFFSLSLNKRMQALDKIKEKRQIAGVKSGESRKIKMIQHKLNTCSTNVERIDESRVKEIKQELEKLRQYISLHTANEIAEYSKSSVYKKYFSLDICQYIEKNGGLSAIKHIIEDANYDNLVVESILKNNSLTIKH